MQLCVIHSHKKQINVIVYSWLQVGKFSIRKVFRTSLLIMDFIYYIFRSRAQFLCNGLARAGIYRFGLLDKCRIPADEDDCGMLKDILKLLEVSCFCFLLMVVLLSNI
jgi:hypothetical protein